MRQEHHLTQAGTSDLICGTDAIVDHELKERDGLLMEVDGLTDDQKRSIENIMSHTPSFEGLETIWKQELFFKRHMGLLEPKICVVGESLVPKIINNRDRVIMQVHKGYYVPFLENIQALLSMPELDLPFDLHLDDRGECRSDILDGNYAKSHPYLRLHPDAVAIMLYVDDFEVVNPIGSHNKKHKLTVYYAQLCNIPSQYRSKLSAIQLVAVALTKDLKRFNFGTKSLLANFIADLKRLHSGVQLTVGQRDTMLRGLLLCVTADTPAAQLLGGFKEGVGTAHRPCRTCDVSRENIAGGFVHEDFTERDEREHYDRCDTLDSDMTAAARRFWSKEYGVVSRSVLMDVPGFMITKGLLHDPMHVLLEGICPMEVKAIIRLFIANDLFSLDAFNDTLTSFPYTEEESRDKPVPISRTTLNAGEHSLRQSSQSMKNLVIVLPFVIARLIDFESPEYRELEPNWNNFILLREIVLLVFSPVIHDVGILLLKTYVATHNEQFVELYADELPYTPKMHYLVHLVQQMSEFGPGRMQSCIRFEAKHGWAKNLRWRNFRNVPKTFAFQHQRWMCYQQAGLNGSPSNNYLYQGDEVKVAKNLTAEDVRHLAAIAPEGFDLNRGAVFAKFVIVHGLKYRPGSILVDYFDDDDFPVLINVDNVIVKEDSKLLLVSEMVTDSFNSCLGSFLVSRKNPRIQRLINLNTLQLPWPLHGRVLGAITFVTLANCGRAPLL